MTASAKNSPYDVKNMKRAYTAFLSGFFTLIQLILPSTIYASDAMDAACTNTVSEISKEPAFTGLSSRRVTPLLFAFKSWHCCKRDRLLDVSGMVFSCRTARVAYATVNGQTGKVVADLPISVGKSLLGSLIMAIPQISILLCSLGRFQLPE